MLSASDVLISEVSTATNTDTLASGTRTHNVELYNGTGTSVNLSNCAIGYMASTDVSTLSSWSFPVGNFFF